MAAEKRKVKKWGWKTLLALLGLAAAGAFGFFSIFNTIRVTAAEPSLSENEANEAASVTITDAELEQLLSGELTLDSLTRTGTDEAPAASEAQGTAAGEQPARTESEAAAPSEPEDSASGTEQSAASSSEAPAEKKQQEAACEAEVKALIQQTYALKAIAEKGLNSSISAAKAEYKTLPAEQQTKTKKIMICLSKTGELTSLQSYCDKEMGRIVSQLRTVLKENGQSTELADQVMSTYKAEKSQRYAELKNKLYTVLKEQGRLKSRSTGEESQSMDNYKAENQEQEIDLVSLFFAVAHRYKQMAAAAVICAVLFGGFGVVKGMLNQRAIDEAIANGEEVPRTSAEQQYEEDMVEYREAQTKHDTDVTSYKQQLNQNEADQVRAQFDIDNAQEYIDKSVRQKLDPYNVYTSETRFYITTDYKIMPGMDYQNPDYTSAVLSAYNSLLTSHESIITIADQFSMEERYMRELISVSVDNATRLLTITTYGEDADEASRIMDLMLKRMEAVRENIEMTVGGHNTKQVSRSDSTTVLTWLRDSQQDTAEQSDRPAEQS